MQPGMMTVEVALSAADYRALQFDFLKRRWWHWGIVIAPILLLMAYVLWVAEPLAVQISELGLDWIYAYYAALLLGFMVFLVICISTRVYFGLANRKHGFAFKPYRISISPEGLHLERDGVRSEIAWRVFWEMRTTASRTFLLLDPQMTYVIPKRSFDSDAEFAAFNDSVRRYLDGARKAA